MYGSAEPLANEGTNYNSQSPQPLFYVMAAIGCMNACNLGYDIGCSGGAAVLMSEELGWTEVQTEMYVGCINIVAAFGGLLSGPLCDGFGRRGATLLSSFTFMLGVLLVASAGGFMQAMLGRVILGASVGLGLTVCPLYVSEIAPPKVRGAGVATIEVAINVGILLGFTANFIFVQCFPENISWRYMIGAGVVLPTLVFLLATFVMLESPYWLITHGRKDEACHVLAKVYPRNGNFAKLADEIESHIQEESALESGWAQIFRPTPAVKLMLLAGVGVLLGQQANGCESLVFYSPFLLEKAGIASREKTFLMTVLVGLAKASFILFAVITADKVGRRPLLLSSTIGMAVCLVGLAGASFNELILAQISLMCLFMAFFSVGMGPAAFIVASEVFSTPIRAKALALGVFSNRLMAGFVSVTALSFMRILSVPGFFLMYSCLAILVAMYIFTFVPETKGKTFEEIEEMFSRASGKDESP